GHNACVCRRRTSCRSRNHRADGDRHHRRCGGVMCLHADGHAFACGEKALMTSTIANLACATMLMFVAGAGHAANAKGAWVDEFPLAKCNMQSTGRNPYLILEPGYQLVLEGGGVKLQITVLDKTRTIGGVDTRVVEEREWKKGKLSEVA